jgi:hypothetical protein
MLADVTLKIVQIPLWNSPNHVLSSLELVDNNPLSGFVNAQIKWSGASNETNIYKYHVYYKRFINGFPIRHKVGEYTPTGNNSKYTASFVQVPLDVISIVVRAVDIKGNLAQSEVSVPVYDNTSSEATWNMTYIPSVDIVSNLNFDDVVKLIRSSYDMNGDHVFNAADASLILSLIMSIHPSIAP